MFILITNFKFIIEIMKCSVTRIQTLISHVNIERSMANICRDTMWQNRNKIEKDMS